MSFFFLWNDGIANCNGNGSLCRILKASCLDLIQHFGSGRCAVNLNATVDNLTQLLLANQERNFQIKLMLGICTVYIAQILRNVFVKDQTANGTINNLRNPLVTNISGNPYFNLCVNGNIAFIVSHEGFVDIPENLAFALFAVLFHGQVIRNPKPYPVSEQQLDDRQTASTSCSQPASGILLLPVLLRTAADGLPFGRHRSLR